jgi:hypothetical protein
MASWIKKSQDGSKTYMQIKFSPPYNAQQPAPVQGAYQPAPSPIHDQVVAAAVKHAPARPAPAQEQEQDQIPF